MSLATTDAKELQALVDSFYWYHTIDLGNGIITRGTVDHRGVLEHYGFPDVSGKQVLDVGSDSGFFSFQFERWGAAQVVATDIDRWRENPPAFDYSPRLKETALTKYATQPGEEELWERRRQIARDLGYDHPNPFFVAKTILGSAVDLKYTSIYDLEHLTGPFDIVFCGTVNESLKDILGAFEKLRKVTKELCIVAASGIIEPTSASRRQRLLARTARMAIHRLGLQDFFLDVANQPVCRYVGNREPRTFWRPSVMCLKEMLEASGFSSVRLYSKFDLPNVRHGHLMKHAVFHCYP